MMKKYLFCIMTALLLNIASAFAQSGETGPLTWVLEDDTLTISGEGEMPDYYFGARAPWSYYGNIINAVIIETGVTTIGDWAFSVCPNMTSMTTPNGITKIGEYAFEDCQNLTSITIPNSVTRIGKSAFYKCKSLISIIIPDGVTRIEDHTFAWCENLTSVILPNSVTAIEYRAFDYCENLTSITIPNNLTLIEEFAFQCCPLTSITLPNSIIEIGRYAFWGCTSLTSINIPKSVIEIGWNAFSGCASMTSIEVESENHYYASEDGVLLNKNKTIFICCPAGKTTCIVPKSVLWFGTVSGILESFGGCTNLTSIEVESGSSYYASEDGVLFDKDKNTLICCPAGRTDSYVIPNCATMIGFCAFHGSKLTSITIPNSITSIEMWAFYGCELTSITIPNSITSIAKETFFLCKNLTSVTIPSSVTNIGSGAFESCKRLTLITNLNPVPPTIGYGSFYDVNVSECTLEVPIGSVSAYKSADGWKEFNIVGIDVGIDEIGEVDVVEIYPNPTNGNLLITNYELRIEKVEFFDLMGRCVGAYPCGRPETAINISHLPVGIYFVRITTDKGTITRKVVKQ